MPDNIGAPEEIIPRWLESVNTRMCYIAAAWMAARLLSRVSAKFALQEAFSQRVGTENVARFSSRWWSRSSVPIICPWSLAESGQYFSGFAQADVSRAKVVFDRWRTDLAQVLPWP